MSTKAYSTLEDKCVSLSAKHLKFEIKRGYAEKKVSENELRIKIKEKKIQKNYKNSTEFVCVWIEGIKKYVYEGYEEIKDFVDYLPR